ncbi:N-acyl-D-amino-acid deacylase family protein [Eudoraea adriatica]|uniref:N-acyl-D-amino-acid deacylase family protein n=1 Tax=Eudoraea adriatica TaxID=446681 RepID=UPI0003663413|nr:D-aminoacylase [Eudoraea adriatica]
MKLTIKGILLFVILSGCKAPESFDVLIKNGQIIDGSGNPSYIGDVGINADTIAAIGVLKNMTGKLEIDATGLVVAPGFINMLSWATESLIEDGKSQSDIRQGITLEVFGEGWSMGPLNEALKQERSTSQGNIKYDIDWTTLDEYLESLVKRGISPNVASFIGATTVRINHIGYEDREPTNEEMESMKAMVKQAMEEGALGVGSSLIYAPAFYSSTEELIELCKAASEYDGMYISHMRSEGNRLLQSIDELIQIADKANIRAEIYHLKMAGKDNWYKFDDVVKKIDSARSDGLDITADMYTYTAGSTGLNASMPPWVQEGGYDKWAERLKDPKIRRRVYKEMTTDTDEWENLMYAAGTADNLLLVSFKNDSLRHYTGKTLAEVAKIHGKSPEETAMDLVIADGSRVGTTYFLMSEENLKKQIALPYMSFGSDAGSLAPEGVFLESNTHPRAYGNFSRLLGKYVRDEKIISLEEAIRKLTSLPASNLKIKNRGSLAEGYFADIAIFNPETIKDHSTFAEPHQFSTGMEHVIINGEQVLKYGEHTGALPGKVVRGPGWIKKAHNNGYK